MLFESICYLDCPNRVHCSLEGLPGKNVILHNPLPDLTHEEFVSLLGPILIPENYPPASPSSTPQPPPPPNTAPFEWLHFECRSFKTTLSNLQGLDGLARDRGWRHKVTFSFDVSGTATADKQRGVHAIVPHVDVVFFESVIYLSLTPSLSLVLINSQQTLCPIPWIHRPTTFPTRHDTPRCPTRAPNHKLGRITRLRISLKSIPRSG
jgi:hypothetical protein